MIYNIKLNIEINIKQIGDNFYNVLGSIYNILGDDTTIKESIVSVSNIYKGKEDNISNINLSINGKINFDKITSIIIYKKEINLNGNIYKINSVDFDIKEFDEDCRVLDYNILELNFKTPTYVKKDINGKDINQFLPNPEIFLTSAIRKFNNIYSKNYNIDEIKNNIKNNVIISRFDIYTKLVTIKNNKKAGVLGKIKYEILDGLDKDVKIILYQAMKLANIIGLGTGIKLGLGQVGVYFNNK